MSIGSQDIKVMRPAGRDHVWAIQSAHFKSTVFRIHHHHGRFYLEAERIMLTSEEDVQHYGEVYSFAREFAKQLRYEQSSQG